MNRRRVANGVRSDVPCQQCGRGLAGLGHSVSDNVAQAEAGKSIAFDIDKERHAVRESDRASLQILSHSIERHGF